MRSGLYRRATPGCDARLGRQKLGLWARFRRQGRPEGVGAMVCVANASVSRGFREVVARAVQMRMVHHGGTGMRSCLGCGAAKGSCVPNAARSSQGGCMGCVLRASGGVAISVRTVACLRWWMDRKWKTAWRRFHRGVRSQCARARPGERPVTGNARTRDARGSRACKWPIAAGAVPQPRSPDRAR